jgi:hypothetical protein
LARLSAGSEGCGRRWMSMTERACQRATGMSWADYMMSCLMAD